MNKPDNKNLQILLVIFRAKFLKTFHVERFLKQTKNTQIKLFLLIVVFKKFKIVSNFKNCKKRKLCMYM